MLYDGEEFEHNGNRFRVAFPPDDAMGAPWKEHDGHGPVSDWRHGSRWGHCYASKKPGERPLHTDGGSTCFYDFAEAVRIAKRDGWMSNADVLALSDPNRQKLTRSQLAARAAEEDFQRLKAWCDDKWSWTGVVVTLLDDDGDATDETASLWGIESDAGGYLEEVARELADEIVSRIRAAT